jgi:hypothetical protein
VPTPAFTSQTFIIIERIRVNMPIVSINLSPRAYQVYDMLAKGRRASRILSTLLVNWDKMSAYEKGKLESAGPILEPGDRRIIGNIQYEWTDTGWLGVEE